MAIPTAIPSEPIRNKLGIPSHRTAVDFASFLEKSTLAVNWEPDDVDYDKAVRDGKLSDYESLARH